MKMTVRGIIFFGINIFLVTLPLDTAMHHVTVKRFAAFLAVLYIIAILTFAVLATA